MLSKRYGILPSEFSKQSIEDYQFNLFVAIEGTNEEVRRQKEAQQKARRR